MKWFDKAKTSGHNPAVCPSCGCPLQDRSWQQCPRCRQELPGCQGCGNCKGH